MYETFFRVLFVHNPNAKLTSWENLNWTKVFEMEEKVTSLPMGVYSECQVRQANVERAVP